LLPANFTRKTIKEEAGDLTSYVNMWLTGCHHYFQTYDSDILNRSPVE